MKKAIAVLLSLMLVIGILPMGAVATETDIPFSLTYQDANGNIINASFTKLCNIQNDIYDGSVYLVSLPVGSTIQSCSWPKNDDDLISDRWFTVKGRFIGYNQDFYEDTSYYMVNEQFIDTSINRYSQFLSDFNETTLSLIPTSNVTGFATQRVVWDNDNFEHATAYDVIIQIGAEDASVSPAITVGAAVVKPGATVTIPVTMANSPEFASFQGTLTYDSSVMTLTSIASDTLHGFMPPADPASGKITAAAAEYYTLNGTLCTATFKIKEDAAYGEYQIGLTDVILADDDKPFDVDVTAGKITVTAAGGDDLENGYSVFMDSDKTVAAGADVDVAVGIAGQGEGFDKYTNYEMTFTYDAEKLQFKGVAGLSEGDEVKAEETSGTITVCKYGTEQISSATGTAFTLQFTAKGSGSAAVKCTGAGIGNKGTIEAGDEITAHLLDDTTVIIVAAPEEYAVSISTGDFDAEVTGAGTATAGQDYTFTVSDPYYDYTFAATVGGVTVTPSGPDENGAYTIPGSAVSGPISITLTKMDPKSFAVVVKDGDGNAIEDLSSVDVTLPDGVPTYKTDYAFTVSKAEGYVYAVSAKIGDEVVTLEPVENEETHTVTYTIAGADIKGDVVITVVKTEAQDVTVEFEGTGKEKVVGGTLKTAKEGQDFSFTVTQDTEHYDYSVTAVRGDESVPVTAGENGAYTIAAAYITAGETPITVTVNETRNYHLQVLGSEYVKMDDSVGVLVRVTGALFEGEDIVWDPIAGGEASNEAWHFSWSTAETYKAGFEGNVDGVWCRVLFAGDSGSINSSVDYWKRYHIKVSTGNQALDYNYNVNLSEGGVDTNDAQLVWNMYNATYDQVPVNTDQVMQTKFLLADTNQDMVLNVLDSSAIVNYIINGQ